MLLAFQHLERIAASGCGISYELNAVWGYPSDIMCAQVLMPWGFAVENMTLPNGMYQAELYVSFPSWGVTELCATKSFFVFDELHQSFLPVIYK